MRAYFYTGVHPYLHACRADQCKDAFTTFAWFARMQLQGNKKSRFTYEPMRCLARFASACVRAGCTRKKGAILWAMAGCNGQQSNGMQYGGEERHVIYGNTQLLTSTSLWQPLCVPAYPPHVFMELAPPTS